MANVLRFFLAPDDELQLFRYLEHLKLEVYPRRIPPDWKMFLAGPEMIDRLPEEDMYLAAAEIGPVMVDPIKRGPDKGFWHVDEVRSPVIYYDRSRKNEEGELVSGRMWAELDVTQQTGRRDPAPDRFRRMYLELEEWFKKTCRRSEPTGFFVGPHAARAYKEGLKLRDDEPPKQRKKGNVTNDGLVRPFR
ncbi:MAG: hypothetical protein ACJ790_21100 [Myxococcaceae bacterium]